jgi:hypothetical protein
MILIHLNMVVTSSYHSTIIMTISINLQSTLLIQINFTIRNLDFQPFYFKINSFVIQIVIFITLFLIVVKLIHLDFVRVFFVGYHLCYLVLDSLLLHSF